MEKYRNRKPSAFPWTGVVWCSFDTYEDYDHTSGSGADVPICGLWLDTGDLSVLKGNQRHFQSIKPWKKESLNPVRSFSSTITWLSFRGIDIKNAETFFKMLVELQDEETIDAATFANACVRMKGAATSIDLQTVMFTTHLMNKDCRGHGHVEACWHVYIQENQHLPEYVEWSTWRTPNHKNMWDIVRY